jgi:large subunit ribosomal protein L35
MKTNRSAAKRFKVTKNGKIKRGHSGSRHLLTHKSPKRKRRLRQTTVAHATDARRVHELLPYS